ncbi:uncharacterized protein LOC109805214 [Cajanus cajan]|nr:uncharacterized protein LOC109805214 [Cajanus cajan]
METPSHTFAASKKIEDSEKNVSKSKSWGKQEDQSALIDITNDSPIVGLANGAIVETPLAMKRGSRVKHTPGSGEALLRGQVKTLLLKVEEEEVELSKFSLETMPPNKPQILNLYGLPSVIPLIPQVANHVFEGKNEENSESEKSLISRSLLLDFSDKSQISNASEECFSELSYEGVGSCSIEQSTEDDDASIWSTQVSASTHDEEDYSEEEKEYDEGEVLLDELCEVLNNISMNAGKHTRFVYNNDDEIVKEEVEENFGHSASSPNILRLKGLPTPKGKHLRFYDEEKGESVL